jgi:hypothetical protein
MKYLLALALIPSLALTEELSRLDMMKLEKRNVELVQSMQIQGKDAFIVGEILQNMAKVYNAMLAEEEKEKAKKKEEVKK